MTAQPIRGLGSEAIPACYTVKTLPIKEPAEAQTGRERVEPSLVP